MTYTYPYTIALHDTDAAGIMYSANLIRICHQAYEAFMESIGFGIGRLLKERPFGMPVVHIEGDFQKPVRVGDKVEIRVRMAEIRRSSVRTAYELVKGGEVIASAAIVHVCVSVEKRRAMELPEEFRKKLKS